MQPIYLPQLAQAYRQTEILEIQDKITGLDSLTPVQGEIHVEHRGNYLKVSARVETIVTLSCDRCLQKFNHRLSAELSELIWLSEQLDEPIPPAVLEEDWGDLVEVLSPQGYFDLEDWLYQQLCLQLPQRQLCDPNCLGVPEVLPPKGKGVDQRWAALEALRQTLDTSPP